jgi:hypothetical protein
MTREQEIRCVFLSTIGVTGLALRLTVKAAIQMSWYDGFKVRLSWVMQTFSDVSLYCALINMYRLKLGDAFLRGWRRRYCPNQSDVNSECGIEEETSRYCNL